MTSELEESKYFVIGGAGFIGSHPTDRLVEIGVVTVHDNLSSERPEFIDHHCGKSSFRFIKGDLLDLNTLKQAVAGHDVVFQLGVKKGQA